ncbi:MAG: hypothetical protein K6G15_12045 [Desulfovibrio sp.]|nr:hypothetical protein [Desulfovibrio sp.]
MKKLLASLVAVFVLSAFAGTAMAKQVIIGNGCNFPLHFIGLSTPNDKEVQNLITEPVAPGDGIQVDLKITKDIDLTVQDNEGTQLEFSGLDLSNASKVILNPDGTANIE